MFNFLQLPLPTNVPADSTVISKLSEQINELKGMSASDLFNTLLQGSVHLVIDLAIALAIFFVGRWLIKRNDKFLGRVFSKRDVEASLGGFLRSMIKAVFYILLLIIIVGVLGINTTSFVAILASAGFAVGMALSGTLQNFAGGVMILFLKPFHVGDYIQAEGQEGTVKEIKLFNTLLNTVDNKTIIIPNGSISTSIVNNFSTEKLRRVDWTFSVSYGNDYDTAQKVLSGMLDADQRVLKTPPYLIALQSLGDNSVNIVVRAWTPSGEYWNVYFDLNKRVYKEFGNYGLTFPFPQLDVHLPGQNSVPEIPEPAQAGKS